MKKLFAILIFGVACLGARAQETLEGVYQIPNSDFETWASDKEPGNGWNSFNSARTTDLGWLASTAKKSAPNPSKYTSAHGGSLAVKLSSIDVLGAKANGNLTTGIINMGSTDASNETNYNFTKRDDESHSLKFAGKPDAAECYAKFKSGGSPNGRVQFIIHGDVNYTDPESSHGKQYLGDDYLDYKVASAAIVITESSEWTRFTADFVYTGSDKTPNVHYMLASATTNPTPGGSANDNLCLDDVKLIYYHSLTSCTYNGQNVEFNAENKASVNALYYESKLTYEKKGVGATVEKAYNKETGVLTITVKGNDYKADNTSVTTYTIQFVPASATLTVKSAAQYGTFCAPFDVTIPEGVTVYTISSIGKNGKLELVEQQSTISAHTPVIVYSKSASDVNAVQFGVATEGEPKSDYLTGVYEATDAPVGSYVLQNQNGRVGFYQVQEGKQPTVGANRAYLDLTNSPVGVKAFYMDDATAIQAVEELLSGKAEIYDLAGRRQQKLQKGINIIGGKKVLVK